MRYKVFFTTGETINVNEETRNAIFEAIRLQAEWTTSPTLDAQIKYITHVVPENTYDQEGGVVTPLTPDQIAETKKKEHDVKISDPSAILKGVVDREEETNG